MPKSRPKAPPRRAPLSSKPASRAPHFAAGLEQRRSLARDDFVVFRQAQVQPARALHFQHFRLDQPARGAADAQGNAGIGIAPDDFHGLGQDVIPQQHGHVVAPALVRGLFVAAQVAAVDDVVVDERTEMDQLHGSADARGAIQIEIASRLRQKQKKGGPDALAAPGQQILHVPGKPPRRAARDGLHMIMNAIQPQGNKIPGFAQYRRVVRISGCARGQHFLQKPVLRCGGQS